MLQEEGKEVAVEVAVKDLQPIGTLRRLGRRGEGEPGTANRDTKEAGKAGVKGSQEQPIRTLRRLGRSWGPGVEVTGEATVTAQRHAAGRRRGGGPIPRRRRLCGPLTSGWAVGSLARP